MTEFKCPCCRSTQFVEVNTVSQLNTDTPYTEEEFDNHGEIQKKNVVLKERGLFNFNFFIRGDAEGKSSMTANCTTRICADCGFVSLNALNIAKEILSDMEDIATAEKGIQGEQAAIQKEQENLQKELDAEEQKEREIKEKLRDENITIKQQRELKEELETLQSRIKPLPKLIYHKQREMDKLSVALRNLQQRKAIIHGYQIIK